MVIRILEYLAWAVSAAMILWMLTDAVTACVPGRRAAVAMLAPPPSGPSRLDVHTSPALRLPSSTSVPEPVKVTVAPAVALVPDVGLVMLTTGALSVLVGG